MPRAESRNFPKVKLSFYSPGNMLLSSRDVRQYGWSIANQGNSTRPWCPHWDSIAFGMID